MAKFKLVSNSISWLVSLFSLNQSTSGTNLQRNQMIYMQAAGSSIQCFQQDLTIPCPGWKHLLHLGRWQVCHSAPSSEGSLCQAVAQQPVVLERYLAELELLTGQPGCMGGKSLVSTAHLGFEVSRAPLACCMNPPWRSGSGSAPSQPALTWVLPLHRPH